MIKGTKTNNRENNYIYKKNRIYLAFKKGMKYVFSLREVKYFGLDYF